MTAFTDDQLKAIQGFGIGGFKKDHQELLFLRFPNADAGKQFVAWTGPQVANAWETTSFNALFDEIKARTNTEPLEATWTALMISAAGFVTLGVPTTDLPAGEGTNAFNQGMAARSAQIGDTRPGDAPGSWRAPFQPGAGVHAAVVVASDDPEDLAGQVEAIANQAAAFGCEVVFQEAGATLPPPLTGHEHFGFRDGLSQPAIADFDTPPAPSEPPAVAPGEFVLGFADHTGAPATAGPLWQNGSFVVFRRLTQDVAAFRTQATADVPGANPVESPELLAAQMVGRWPSGAPLELNPASDPGPAGISNAFQYGANGDNDGQKCPVWAHIRKANPRDEATPGGAADDPGLHRMLRRGIPFGPPLPSEATADDGLERGLHFFCVVTDLNRQFEFIQAQWLNSPNFPTGTPKPTQPSQYGPPAQGPPNGPDPVVGEHDDGVDCVLVQASGSHPFPLPTQVVHVTAGEYFFLPSISALTQIGAAPKPTA